MVQLARLLPTVLSKFPYYGRYYKCLPTAPTVTDTISPLLEIPSQETSFDTVHERQLGDSEISYFLPSRGNGVNDMYLHIGFQAPAHLVRRERVRIAWATLRARHPLLASKVVMRDYDDVSFVYTRRCPKDELADADKNLDYRSSTKDELIDSYLNGPRTLSNDRLSYLVISQTSSPSSYELLICATHFIGDGIALHQFANDLFGLLTSNKTDQELETELCSEWRMRTLTHTRALPDALETSFPLENKWRLAAGQVASEKNEEKQIGGHAFPRRSAPTRHTVTRVISFDAERTKSVLKKCKHQSVSVSAALFAICNIAWIRLTPDKPELPVLLYSALNMRPYISNPQDSYWFLAVGYFNVTLSNFLPGSVSKASAFWARARSAKQQSVRAAKSPLIVSRSRRTATERAQRSRAWAKEDDEKARGTWVEPPAKKAKPLRAPSTALIGLSLLGNLDSIYQHAKFPGIELHTLTTGSRQRAGAMLLFGYTFAGKLWLSLGYDENGLDNDVVEEYWKQCLRAVDEFL